MSGPAVFQEALRLLCQQQLPPVAHSDVHAVLEFHRQSAPLQFLYDAGLEAQLPNDAIIARSGAIFLCYCAGQVADDLADDECTYLELPSQTGPVAQFILQNLFFGALLDAGLPSAAVSAAASDLVRGAGPQHIEVRTKTWTLARAQQVAEGISGCQFSAYLRLLFHGTPLEGRAPAVGRALGLAAHIAMDVRTDDARFTTLSVDERRDLIRWAVVALEQVRAEGLLCTRLALSDIEPVLAAAS
jgi:hypothetical protein